MTRKRRVIGIIVGLVALAAVLVGAGKAGAAVFRRAPDHAHIVVTRIQPPSGSQSIVFDQQVGDVAGQMYAQLVSGGQIPEGAVMSCPSVPVAAPYYRYELTFSRLGIQTAVATSDARGCEVLTLTYSDGGHEYHSFLAPNGTSFWETLHRLVNAPVPI
jgi:hypothetical protein